MNERITPYDPELAKSITKEGQRIVRELAHELEDKISMNERIQELAEQARLGRGPEKIHISENGVVIFYLDELEKFADLIARECIEDCRDMFMVGSVSWNLLNEKLEHFGVEE